MGVKLLNTFFILAALTISLLAQSPPTDRKEPGPGNTRQPPATNPSRTQQNQEWHQRPLFLTGKVMLDDGTPLPEPVRVGLVCYGSLKRQDYTSLDGSFSMQIDDSPGAAPVDASIGSRDLSNFKIPGTSQGFGRGIGQISEDTVNLSGCELVASLPGFRSDTVQLGIRRVLDNPDVGTIMLRRLAKVEGTTISLNSLSAPKKARKEFEKARKELGKNKPNLSKAVEKLEKAVKIHPQFAAAWQLLGEARMAGEDREGAREAFQKAMDADPQYISPYLSLAQVSLLENQWGQAAEMSSKALNLNPYITRAYYFHAISNFSMGKMELAEESAKKVQTSGELPQYPATHYMLGVILAQRGDFSAAADALREFLQAGPNEQLANQLRQQLQTWESQGLIPKPRPRD